MFPATAKPKDHFAKPRALDYFDQLLTDDPDKLFRKYAVHPPDDAKFSVPTAEPKDFGRFAASVQAEVSVGAVPATHLIAWAHLTKKSRTASATEGFEGSDCIFMEASHTPNAHVPIYFLPWKTAQILHLTIPPKNPNANAIDPDIFFTSAVSGCSIFIQGTARNPTIFHCGGSPTSQDSGRNSATVWRQLVNFYTGNRSQAEVNKTHYVREFDDNRGVATQRSIDYVNTLAATRPNVQITSVQPWGCVFGYRDAHGDWQFFLQENATLHIYAVTGQNVQTVKRAFGQNKIKITDIVTQKAYARPLAVRQIWPGHGGAVTLTPHLPIITQL